MGCMHLASSKWVFSRHDLDGKKFFSIQYFHLLIRLIYFLISLIFNILFTT